MEQRKVRRQAYVLEINKTLTKNKQTKTQPAFESLSFCKHFCHNFKHLIDFKNFSLKSHFLAKNIIKF